MCRHDRYTTHGPADLGDPELLALVLGKTGPARPAPSDIAGALLSRFGGLAGLLQAPVAALSAVQGVGPAGAVRLHAALQAGHRAACATRAPSGAPIASPAAAAALLHPVLAPLDAEELHALLLDRRRRLVAHIRLTRGSDRFTIVDPRQVFRPAVQAGAAAVVVAHNHPSGDPTPSPEDRQVTRRLVEAGRVLGVPLLDHIIVASQGWTSLAEQGDVPVGDEAPRTWVRCAG